MNNKTVLIVDDDDINRAILKEIIQTEYSVEEAKNGEEALDALYNQDGQFCAVVLDLLMPGKSGYDVLSDMKSSPILAKIPVVVVTAMSTPEAEIEAFELGAADLLTKPYNPQILLYRIKNVTQNFELENLKTLMNRMQYRLEHDSLTGILNSDAFMDNSENYIRLSEKQCVIAWINIKGFKVINDLFGIHMGDSILKDIAYELYSIFHEDAIIARTGSDHFAVTFVKGYIEYEELLDRIENNIMKHHYSCTIILQIGLFEVNEKSMTVENMYNRANVAAQQLKNLHKSGYFVYNNDMREHLLTERRLISDFDYALEENEFTFYIQPVFSIKTGKMVAGEALCRWEHHDLGLVLPSIFVPIFEKNGYIQKIDYAIWEQVAEYIKNRVQKKQKVIPIVINISRTYLFNNDWVEDLLMITKRYGISVKYLKPEITEGSYGDNPAQLIEAVKKLRKYGFDIAMDDFGKVNTSLNILKDVEFSTIKFDMKYLGDLDISNRTGNILSAIVKMSNWLGMDVIAEGVETKQQADFLSSIGCNFAQGYYFSKPMPIEQFNSMLKSNKVISIENSRVFTKTEELNGLFDNNLMINKLFDSVLGGFGVFEYSKGKLEILRVNESYYELFKSSPLLLSTEHNIFELISEEDKLKLEIAIKKAIKTGKTIKEIVFSDNMYLLCNIKFIGTMGKKSLLCVALEDVTEHKKKDRLINEQQKNMNEQYKIYTAMFENAPYAIINYYKTNDTKIIDFNNKAVEYFGVSTKDELYNEFMVNKDTLFMVKKSEREKIRKIFQYSLDNKLQNDITVEITNKKKQKLLLKCFMQAINFNDDKTVLQVICMQV